MTYLTRQFLKGLCQRRCFSTTKVRFIDPKSVEEVKIPVPWGHIAGKWWGSKTGTSTIAIHGHLDNANSFDQLMPHLNISGALCLDVPGHGFSSHIPKGLIIQYIDYVSLVRYLVKHYLKWKEVSFIGHSFGANLCFSYAAIFPCDVKSLVILDWNPLPSIAVTDRTCQDLRGAITAALASDIEPQTKTYNWEETVKHMYKVRSLSQMPLSIRSCEIICERGTTNINDKFRFSVDGRLKARSDGRLSEREYITLAKRLSCDVLNIKTFRGLQFMQNANSEVLLKEFNENLESVKKFSKRFIDFCVDGCHHVHLEEPQKISPFINKFLNCT